MSALTFRAQAIQGKIVPFDSIAYYSFISSLDKKEIDITIDIHRKKRTLTQNAYYWWICDFIGKEASGYTKDEMHRAFQELYLCNDPTAKVKTYQSTKDLDTAQMTGYIDSIKRDAAMRKFSTQPIYVPDADEIGMVK